MLLIVPYLKLTCPLWLLYRPRGWNWYTYLNVAVANLHKTAIFTSQISVIRIQCTVSIHPMSNQKGNTPHYLSHLRIGIFMYIFSEIQYIIIISFTSQKGHPHSDRNEILHQWNFNPLLTWMNANCRHRDKPIMQWYYHVNCEGCYHIFVLSFIILHSRYEIKKCLKENCSKSQKFLDKRKTLILMIIHLYRDRRHK